MLASLGLAAGVALGSALVPLINAEIFLIALVAREPTLPWLALGATVAAGQVAGKLLYYFAARGSLRLPAFLHRRPKPGGEDGAAGADIEAPAPRRTAWRRLIGRWRTRLDRIVEKCHRHPHWMAGTYGVSSLLGVPPFMATTILAGLVRMPVLSFVLTGLIGRGIRFSVLAACPALLAGWLF